MTQNTQPSSERYTPIPRGSEADPADAEMLSRYSVATRFESTRKVTVAPWRDCELRFPGHIVLAHPARKITIVLYDGATRGDLDGQQAIVRALQAGHRRAYPFRPASSHHGVEVATIGHPACSPATVGDELVVACNEPDCIHDVHFRDDPSAPDLHETNDGFVRDGYAVEVSKTGDDDWQVYLTARGPLSPSEATALASDLQWLSAQARGLNEKVVR